MDRRKMVGKGAGLHGSACPLATRSACLPPPVPQSAVAAVAREQGDPDPLLLPQWLYDVAVTGRPLPSPLWLPSALVLMSHHPLFGPMRNVLCQLLRLSVTPNLPLPLEHYVGHVIFDLPLPPRGYASVGLTLGDRHIVIARPPPNELPGQDLPLRPLFQCLDLGNLLSVFTAVLCESQVALCSTHTALLTPVAEAICSLLFPFKVVVSYIPVLPKVR
jgi:hypothetical protein